VAANTGSSGEGPPVRSYTIDLSNGSARTAPLQSTDSAGESAAGTAPANGSAASTPGVTPPVVPPPVAPSPAAPAAKAKPTPAAPVSAPNHAASKAASVTASTSGWSVQLGLFASHDNAERLMHAAQSKGFPVSVSDADGKGLYHVVAAGLADRAAAQALQGRLQTQGFQAALVAPQSGNLKSSH
jgi:cell division septation protein DedD